MNELIQIGVFERRMDAEQAMSSLLKAGFRHHQLGLAERRPDRAGGLVVDELTWLKGGARTAAMAGLAGAATSLLGVLGFPGFPVTVAVTVAMGSLFGAIVGAVLEPLLTWAYLTLKPSAAAARLPSAARFCSSRPGHAKARRAPSWRATARRTSRKTFKLVLAT